MALRLRSMWWPMVTWNSDLEWIGVPLWNAIVVFGLMFVYLRFFRDYRRRKRVKLRLCVKCGYDLRGSKERCPECGTTF